MSILPTNTAPKDAEKDAGYVSPDQVEQKVKKEVAKERKAQAQRDAMWQKVAQCKSPKEYKDLIDENFDSVDYLLDLLDADAARTTILNSARLSPSDYLKLKVILGESKIDLKDFFVEAINTRYQELKSENKKP